MTRLSLIVSRVLRVECYSIMRINGTGAIALLCKRVQGWIDANSIR